jgi:RimK family alpha-L-glutamate ligase
MKISLLTSHEPLIENNRIEQEVRSAGYEFELIDSGDATIAIEQSAVQAGGLENIKADVIIVRGVFQSLKTLSQIIANNRKYGVKMFDNNLLSHLYSIDKRRDTITLALAGLPVPDTCIPRSFDEMREYAAKRKFPMVVKPARMGKGNGVTKVENVSDLQEFIEKKESEEKEAKSFLLQEFVPYVVDLRILCIGEHTFVMRRIPREGDFRANFSLGGDVAPYELDEDGKALARSAMKAVGLEVAGVDMLITEDNKRYILEVNHTPGFVGMEQALGQNIGKLYVEHAIKSAK